MQHSLSVSTNCRHAGRVRKRKLYFAKLNSSAYVGTVEFNLAESKQPQGKLDVSLAVFCVLSYKIL